MVHVAPVSISSAASTWPGRAAAKNWARHVARDTTGARAPKSEGPSQQLEPSVVDPEPGFRRILRRTVLGDDQVSGGHDQSHGLTSLRDLLPLRAGVLRVPLM